MTTSHATVTVIGASAAGLASAACLKLKGIDFQILEKSDVVGQSWRNHYDRLHLHTSKGYSKLPHLALPGHYPKYPSRDQLVQYFEQYVDHFDLDIQFNQCVESATYQDGMWHIKTQDKEYTSEKVVVGTGYARVPHLPTFEGQDSFDGDWIHSGKYKNGSKYEGQNVLVIGFGNSACEIAIDLYEHGAKPALAVRSHVNVIPRDLLGIPILTISGMLNLLPPQYSDMLSAPIIRATIGDITEVGLRKAPYGPKQQIFKDGRIPLIDIGTMDLLRSGNVVAYRGLSKVEGNTIHFEDGKSADFDHVISATGWRPALSTFIHDDDLFDEKGVPLKSGEEVAGKGIYFCGFFVSPGGMLSSIRNESQQIAELIHESIQQTAKVS